MSIKRKIMVGSVGIIIAASLVSVGIKVKASGDNTQVVRNEEDNKKEKVIEIAKQVYLDFVKGDIKNIYYNRCNSSFRENVAISVLEELGNIFKEGTFIDFNYTSAKYYETEEDKYYSVLIVGKFKEDFIQIKCNIDSDNNVIGMFNIYKYSSIDINPIENEVFKEQIVKIGDYELTGILTLPKNKENVPVVVIESGSGPTSANGKEGLLNPYQDIAYGLAKYGIATLRYNDRYYERQGVWSNSDTIYDEYIDDASAAIKLLGSLDGIDKNNIFVLGHSQGGSVIPTIAKLNPNVKGIISLAGTPRSIIYAICEQHAILDKLKVTSEEEKKQIDEKYNAVLNECLNIIDDSEEMIFDGVTKTYIKSINDLNIEDTVRKLQIPMLILQGDKDVNVTIEKDYSVWQRLLENKENVHFKIYNGLSHLMTKSKGKPFGEGHVEDLMEPNHVEENVIKDIAEFINIYK